MLGPLTNTSKIIYTYNAKNNLLTTTEQEWDSDSWANSVYTVNTYDSRSNLLTRTMQVWESGEWKNGSKNTYTYDTAYNQTNWLVQTWNNGDWENVEQWIFTFDTRDNMTSETYQTWTAGAWLNSLRYLYTFNSTDELLAEVQQNWEGDAWVNQTKDSWTYEAGEKIISTDHHYWMDNEWIRVGITVETFDSNNFPVTYSSKLFDEDELTVLSGDSARYYYRGASSGIGKLADGRMTVYPNPTSGKFIVSCSENISALEICNAVGEIVFSKREINNQTIPVDLSQSFRGVFIIRISTEAKTFSTKIILR